VVNDLTPPTPAKPRAGRAALESQKQGAPAATRLTRNLTHTATRTTTAPARPRTRRLQGAAPAIPPFLAPGAYSSSAVLISSPLVVRPSWPERLDAPHQLAGRDTQPVAESQQGPIRRVALPADDRVDLPDIEARLLRHPFLADPAPLVDHLLYGSPERRLHGAAACVSVRAASALPARLAAPRRAALGERVGITHRAHLPLRA